MFLITDGEPRDNEDDYYVRDVLERNAFVELYYEKTSFTQFLATFSVFRTSALEFNSARVYSLAYISNYTCLILSFSKKSIIAVSVSTVSIRIYTLTLKYIYSYQLKSSESNGNRRNTHTLSTFISNSEDFNGKQIYSEFGTANRWSMPIDSENYILLAFSPWQKLQSVQQKFDYVFVCVIGEHNRRSDDFSYENIQGKIETRKSLFFYQSKYSKYSA